MTAKNTRQFIFAGYTFEQEKQLVKLREQYTDDYLKKAIKRSHDLFQMQIKSNQVDPVRVSQYERD